MKFFLALASFIFVQFLLFSQDSFENSDVNRGAFSPDFLPGYDPTRSDHGMFSSDGNDDGVVDQFIVYSSVRDEIRIITAIRDSDFNGEMDTFCYYNNTGILIKEERDTDSDGRIDLWIQIHNGISIASYEQDTDFDGKADTKKIYIQ